MNELSVIDCRDNIGLIESIAREMKHISKIQGEPYVGYMDIQGYSTTPDDEKGTANKIRKLKRFAKDLSYQKAVIIIQEYAVYLRVTTV